MKRFAAVLTLPLFAFACASSDDDVARPSPRSDGPRPVAQEARAALALDMLPPPDWWHQPMLVDAVHLSADQMTALDKIASDQADDIARLDRDSMVAVRDLRTLLESNKPATSDIVSAGQRLRALRDTLFDRQLQMLAAERQVLTLDQWQMLQQQLQERRQQRMQDQGYPRRGGRGMGGRGRWPGQ